MKRVVHSSQKEREKERERERYKESVCVRHPDTPGEVMSMCEREMPMHIKCVQLCVR